MSTDLRAHAPPLELPGRLAHLGEFLAYVDDACLRSGVQGDAALQLRLAVEEACINVMRHGYGDAADAGPLTIGLRRDGDEVTVTVADRAPLFRPGEAPAADTTSAAEGRIPGGLGWHLIRSSVDEIHHRPAEGGGNVLTLVKRLDTPTKHG
jgi:anti-sigma regulatory factor (Ser/Thr protein kinase)